MMLPILFVFAVLITSTDALQCATCSNITIAQTCQTFVTCRQGERCYASSFGIGQETLLDLGCKSEMECISSSAISIVGRSISSVQCSQCCAVDRCNLHLCSGGTQVTNEVGQCADDPTFDCQHLSSLFNICGDIAHAKTACRKYCGLCNLVDGSWGTWTSWSSTCSVTCGKGDVIRSRTCTNPSPAHGGLPCSGNATEATTCSLELCPVHGGWSSWKSWGFCSQSCGIGTQSRHRACDNPKPKFAGNHCFGDGSDFKACFARSCTDGDWSTWSPWSTCAGGEKFRNRTCDNPAPSQFGRGCVGDTSMDARCGPVAFTFNYVSGEYSSTTLTLIFKNVLTNIGGGYNTTTGKFTCTMPGLYSFTLTLYTSSNNKIYCKIRKNSHYVGLVVTGDSTQDIGTSTSLYLSLSVGDIIDVGNCGGDQHIDKSYASLFAGALQ